MNVIEILGNHGIRFQNMYLHKDEFKDAITEIITETLKLASLQSKTNEEKQNILNTINKIKF